MPAIPKIPETEAEYQVIAEYLHSKMIPEDVLKKSGKPNFIRRYKKFVLDENRILYTPAVVKNGITVERCYVVSKYDQELHT